MISVTPLGNFALASGVGIAGDTTTSSPSFQLTGVAAELGEVSKLRSEFEKRNVKTIALSVDGVDSHNGWIGDINETQSTTVDYPILSD